MSTSTSPTWAIIGDDAPLSDSAISALATLLLALDDPEPTPNQSE